MLILILLIAIFFVLNPFVYIFFKFHLGTFDWSGIELRGFSRCFWSNDLSYIFGKLTWLTSFSLLIFFFNFIIQHCFLFIYKK